MASYTIHAVVFQREEWWVAQCLQYDIAAQAKNLKDLRYELDRTLVGHMVISEEKNTEPFEHLPAAPEKYWAMFNEALKLGYEPMPFRIPKGLQPPVPEFRIAA